MVEKYNTILVFFFFQNICNNFKFLYKGLNTFWFHRGKYLDLFHVLFLFGFKLSFLF